jgi:hypothetical protein
MATRGAKPKVTALKAVTGNPGKRELKKSSGGIRHRLEALVPMKRLTKMQQQLWDRFVDPAWWLTEFDVPKAHSWVVAKARELSKPKEMTGTEKKELRMLESELLFDVNERIRRGIQNEDDDDPTERFFD